MTIITVIKVILTQIKLNLLNKNKGNIEQAHTYITANIQTIKNAYQQAINKATRKCKQWHKDRDKKLKDNITHGQTRNKNTEISTLGTQNHQRKENDEDYEIKDLLYPESKQNTETVQLTPKFRTNRDTVSPTVNHSKIKHYYNDNIKQTQIQTATSLAQITNVTSLTQKQDVVNPTQLVVKQNKTIPNPTQTLVSRKTETKTVTSLTNTHNETPYQTSYPKIFNPPYQYTDYKTRKKSVKNHFLSQHKPK